MRKKYARTLWRLLIFLPFLIILITSAYIFLFEKYALPPLRELAGEYALERINTSLNNAVCALSKQQGITAEDMYTPHFNASGELMYMEVNSILINELCADTAQALTDELSQMPPCEVSVPAGVLTGINMLSSHGPEIKMRLIPSGSAKTDYETSVESAGIGQVNFKVWLVADTEMIIVNPFLINNKFCVTRKLMLVNTVFSGKVPNAIYGGIVNGN